MKPSGLGFQFSKLKSGSHLPLGNPLEIATEGHWRLEGALWDVQVLVSRN